MRLQYGSRGTAVTRLQDDLNRLPSQRAPLAADGVFGPLTKARVQEFQGSHQLIGDGVVGSLTATALALALEALGKLGTPSAPKPPAVRSINQYVLGAEGIANLVPVPVPSIPVIAESTFRVGDAKNAFGFAATTATTGRLGVFVASKQGVERAVLLLLPASGKPERALICISQTFGQSLATAEALGWADPLSKDLIEFCLAKHVVHRWGAQALQSRKRLAFVYIVRAKGKELGPFANDGAFVAQVLGELATMTGDSFGHGDVDVMTFSSGIKDGNVFLGSLAGHLPVHGIYNIDPSGATPAVGPAGAIRKQYLSGVTGGPRAGFEFLPLQRWTKEPHHAQRKTWAGGKQGWEYEYLHNHCLPQYALHLGLQTS